MSDRDLQTVIKVAGAGAVVTSAPDSMLNVEPRGLSSGGGSSSLASPTPASEQMDDVDVWLEIAPLPSNAERTPAWSTTGLDPHV